MSDKLREAPGFDTWWAVRVKEWVTWSYEPSRKQIGEAAWQAGAAAMAKKMERKKK